MTRLIATTALATQPYPDEALMLMAAPFVKEYQPRAL